MPRFKLTLEYAGTRYSGWQVQKNARTVAGEIDRAVREATGAAPLELYGAGRTDAGVHALAQVAHLDVRTGLPAESLRRRVNDALPADINLLRVEPVQHRFHARHDAVARVYLYQIATRRTAFGKPFVWWVREPLDATAMARAAAAFEGFRDYASFTIDDPEDKSTTVAVSRVRVEASGDLVLVRVEGSHFLWRMVRRMVGVLVAIGRGELREAHVGTFLQEPSSLPATLTAPASGLFLERVIYPADEGSADGPTLLNLPSWQSNDSKTSTDTRGTPRAPLQRGRATGRQRRKPSG
jgi:tRNA pseudouridine38-40 synthase